jgi:hypothetical protein
VDALGNAGHLGVAVPVELESVGHEHKEKGELRLHLDGQGDDGVGLSQLIHDGVEFWQFNFAHFLD